MPRQRSEKRSPRAVRTRDDDLHQHLERRPHHSSHAPHCHAHSRFFLACGAPAPRTVVCRRSVSFLERRRERKRFGGKPRFEVPAQDRKSTRLNSSHPSISYAVFCLKKKNKIHT